MLCIILFRLTRVLRLIDYIKKLKGKKIIICTLDLLYYIHVFNMTSCDDIIIAEMRQLSEKSEAAPAISNESGRYEYVKNMNYIDLKIISIFTSRVYEISEDHVSSLEKELTDTKLVTYAMSLQLLSCNI